MANPFIGQITMFGGNFAPNGWAFCDGQLVPISEYDSLFSVIGTTYGGDGQNTFALPNLNGRLPIGTGQGPGLSPRTLGEAAGTETSTVSLGQMPGHTHALTLNASSGPGNSASPAAAVLAVADGARYASGTAPNAGLAGPSIALGNSLGGGVPHDNLQPFLAVNFIISLYGIFPSQS